MLLQDKKSRFGVNGSALALIAALGPGLFFGAVAQAQTPAPTPAPTPKASTTAATAVADEADDSEEIVVTGTSVRGVKATGSEAVTLGREEIEATGMTSLSQVLGTLSQFQNGVAGGANEVLPSVQTVITQPTVGGNQNAINGINLRGLGNGATLVLINGFRTGSSGGESTVDVNSIPISALQRVDVVLDGASAVYGSDAVAGVVNFVLRQDYKGVEAGARYSWQEGRETEGASVTMGTSWDFLKGGNILATFDYDHQDALSRSTSPYLLDDKSPLGGNNALGLRGAVAPPSLSPYIVFNTAGTATPNPYCGGAGQTIVNPNVTPLFLDIGRCSDVNRPAIPYFAVSPVTGTSVPTAAQVLAAGAPKFVDQADYTDILGERFTRSVTLTGSQRLNDIFNLRAQAVYSGRETIANAGLITQSTTMSPGSPFYITGLATTSTNQPASYNVITPLGVRVQRTYSHVLNTATSLDVKLPADWAAETNFTYNYTRDLTGNFSQYRDKKTGYVMPTGANGIAIIANEATAGRFNYYSNTNVFDENSALTSASKIKSKNVYTALRLKFDGPLFTLPAGEVKAAFGAEHSKEMADRDGYAWGAAAGTPPVVRPTSMNENDLEQVVNSYFAEVNIPIISDLNRLPLFESLTFSAAVRSDDYSQFGKTTNPKYGLSWEPFKDLQLRATYSTAFKSPGLQNASSNPLDINILSGVFNLVNATTAPSPYAGLGTPVQTVTYVGRKPSLNPETSDNKQLGFDFTPKWFEGLKLSGTWYSINYKNRIDSPAFMNFLLSNDLAKGYSDNIIMLTQNQTAAGQAKCLNNPSVANLDPALVAYIDPIAVQQFFFNAATFPTAVCTAPILVDGRIDNLGSQLQEGYDVDVSYRKDTPIGQLSGGVSMTKVTKVEASSNRGGVTLPNVIDVMGGVLGTQGRANLGWSNAGFSAQLAANYTGSYVNDRKTLIRGVSLPVYEIGSRITYDLTLGYRFGEGTGPLEGLRSSLSIVNLTDKDPPYAPGSTTSVYDSAYANPYGRIFTLRLTKEF